MTEYDLGKVVGDDGEAGNGIASITKTGTSGLVDTYTITYDDGTTTTFTVTNGSDASVTIQTSWGSTTSDSKVPSEKLTKDTLDTKITKSSTTGLMKNDGTIMTSGTGSTNYSAGNHTHSGYISTSSTSGLVKNDGSIMTGGTGSSNWAIGNHTHSGYQATLVSGTNIKTINNESLLGSGNITIQGGSSVDVVTSWEATLSDSKVPSEKLVKNTIDGLSIPTKTSDLTNDGDGTNAFLTQHQSLSNYVQKSSTTGLLKNDGTVMTSGTGSTNYSAGNHTHSGYISTSSTTGLIKNDGTVMTSGTGSSNYAAGNHTHSGYVSATKVTSWQSTPSDSNVPSEKLVKDTIDDLIGTAIQYIQQ